MLFHLGVLDALPRSGGPVPFAERLDQVRPPVRAALVAYLERKRATCAPKTVSAVATRLKHFGVFLAEVDPDLDSIAALDRCRHIEPNLTSLLDATSMKNGEPITVADRSRRVLALACFLTDITEWGWPEAPPRKLLFRDDVPKLPHVLPRYLPVDVDRRLTTALTEQPGNELAAAALRLQRSCGLRIGELLDLELDCVHEITDGGSWLKVPLGKLDTERMVPLDTDILELMDRITELRDHGRPLPHPRYRRPAQFLFTRDTFRPAGLDHGHEPAYLAGCRCTECRLSANPPHQGVAALVPMGSSTSQHPPPRQGCPAGLALRLACSISPSANDHRLHFVQV